ncbi:MAG: response regulator transcription factor [Chloroflexi bacterium]|nr:response regulator transcription factor [Chloroflexota bacterium]
MAKDRILLVEDDDAIGHLMALLLEEEGYDVQRAITGRDCVDAVALSRPDLVLLDLMLPEMGGLDCARAIRSRYGMEVPIVVVTAVAPAIRDAYAAEVDAAGSIAKPFDLEDVIRTVQAVLRDRPSRN